jgi:hypothetical protein
MNPMEQTTSPHRIETLFSGGLVRSRRGNVPHPDQPVHPLLGGLRFGEPRVRHSRVPQNWQGGRRPATHADEAARDRPPPPDGRLRRALPGLQPPVEEVRTGVQAPAGLRQVRGHQRTQEHTRSARHQGTPLQLEAQLRALPAALLRQQGEL